MTLIAPHYHKAKKNAAFTFFKKDRYLVKTPWWMKKLFPHCIWDMPKNEKILYLTFDDGPHPEITPFVLNELKKYNAKATFFCIGENVVKHADVYKRLIDEGHSVGNHTHHHINGWKTDDTIYLKDIEEASAHIQSSLFRPPYGRISKSQIKKISKGEIVSSQLSIIMWNILAGDWDTGISPEKCYRRIKNKITAGDIIVFHDSEKARDRMSYALPLLLNDFTSMGYQFAAMR